RDPAARVGAQSRQRIVRSPKHETGAGPEERGTIHLLARRELIQQGVGPLPRRRDAGDEERATEKRLGVALDRGARLVEIAEPVGELGWCRCADVEIDRVGVICGCVHLAGLRHANTVWKRTLCWLCGFTM